MSTNNNDNEVDEVCASCGIINIKLKRCACKLVKYCSVACQKEHRPQHQRACRKRAAELRDELLFQQPEMSHLGECPICCLPLSLDLSTTSQRSCCTKIICDGCCFAYGQREEEESLEPKCPFCRTPTPETEAEADQYSLKRVQANDPVAIRLLGVTKYRERNYSSAFTHWTKAAKLDDVEAHYQLAVLYMDGQGVNRDKKKETFHWEEAAIGGHPGARYNLGINEGKMGRIERAVKHHAIAAALGHDGSMEKLKEGYTRGFIKKEDLAAALRAHKAAVDETKSPQRESAEQEQLFA